MKFLVFLLGIVSISVAETNHVEKVRVTGDRVSLRTRPSLDGELLDRAMRGEEMVCFETTNGWTAVQAPDSLDFWVSGKFVQNGVVQPGKLNVRSGPSPNYNVVAVVNKDDSVSVRGEFNDWLKIAPPVGSRVWISADYVEKIEPPKPLVESKPKIEEPPEELPSLMLELDKTKKQGVNDEVSGILRPANPGLYKLVYVKDDIEETRCLVRGRERQMERYLNRSMLIKGKKYWVMDVDVPIIQPDKIQLNPFLAE